MSRSWIHRRSLRRLALTSALLATPALAAAGETATATIADRDGKTIGMATLTETFRGVLLTVEFEGLPAGVHAFHIHETGACDPATGFASAGGHFNPTGVQHGLLAEHGAHLGDLPNIHSPGDSSFVVEIWVHGLTLADGPGTLFDDDGASLVVHEHQDDYVSDPAGEAGPRIACGVIRK